MSLLLPLGFCGNAVGAESEPDETRPTYEMRLNPGEFHVLSTAMAAGVEKEGNRADLEFRSQPQRMAPGTVMWKVTFSESRALETLNVWLGRSTLTFLRDSEPFRDAWFQPQTTSTLEAVQGLANALETAREHPRWPLIRVTGDVRRTSESAVVTSDGRPPMTITGSAAELAQSLDGGRAVLRGYRKTSSTLELVDATAAPGNTVEVYTMGLCPYGVKAAVELLEHARSDNGTSAPVEVQVRYLVAVPPAEELKPGEKPVIYTLHGAGELVEDGVQILLRDSHPDHFLPYLKARAEDLASTWTEVAATAGVPPEVVQSISGELARPGLLDHLLLQDYQHMMVAYGQLLATPTYAWEGKVLESLESVPLLAPLVGSIPEGACGTPH